MANPVSPPGEPIMRAVVWQRVEGVLVFVGGLILFWTWNESVPWWAAIVLFFAPDLSFLAYLMGSKIGALGYNAVHIYAFGVVLMALGMLASAPLLAACGALWLSHCGFDRMLGYGLKSPEGFTATHLGNIGR